MFCFGQNGGEIEGCFQRPFLSFFLLPPSDIILWPIPRLFYALGRMGRREEEEEEGEEEGKEEDGTGDDEKRKHY